MSAFKQQIDTFLQCDRLLNNRAAILAQQKQQADRIHQEVLGFARTVQTCVTNPNTVARVNYVLSAFPQYRQHPQTKKVYLGTVAADERFTPADYQQVLKRCWNQINAIRPGTLTPQAADTFFRSYNTLLLLLEVKNQLADACVQMQLSSVNTMQSEEQLQVNLQKALDALLAHRVEATAGNILLGTAQVPLPEEDRVLLQNSGVTITEPFGDAVRLTPEHPAAFLHCQSNQENAMKIRELVRGIFYHNVLAYNPGDFRIAIFEHRNDAYGSVLGAVAEELAKEANKEENHGRFDSCLYHSVSEDGKDYMPNGDKKDFEVLLEALNEEQGARATAFSIEGYSNLSDYNAKNPRKTKAQILFLLYGFPEDMISGKYISNETVLKKLENLIKNGGKYGIYVLCMGENKPIPLDGEKSTWFFDCARLGMQEYALSSEDYAWVSADAAFAAEVVRTYVQKAGTYFALPIQKLFDEIGDTFVRPEIGVEIAIPFGISEGKPYCFASSTSEARSKYKAGPHSMILGKSGKGKTSLIKTIILSGAHYYSPDELQFYLLDFKAREGNVDYQEFVQDGTNNCYVPHIRFISLQGHTAFADEVLQMMENLIVERKNRGCSDYEEYCDRRRNNPSIPPIPAIFFMIDEYNAIFNDKNYKLRDKLNDLTNRCRQAGIHIVLIGQEDTMGDSQFVNRYGFGADTYRSFSNFFPGNTEMAMIPLLRSSFTEIQGKPGVVASLRKNASGDRSMNVVKNAFASEAEAVAARIRERYADRTFLQQKGGSGEKAGADNLHDITQNYPVKVVSEDRSVSYRVPLGISALDSSPVFALFGSRSDGGGRYYANYFVQAGVQRQIRVLENAMFSYAGYLKERLPKGSAPHISFNYFGDWNQSGEEVCNLADRTARWINDHQYQNLIRVNATKWSVLEEIEKAYQLYVERNEADFRNEEPYLMAFLDCYWITQYQSILPTLKAPQGEQEIMPPDMQKKVETAQGSGQMSEKQLELFKQYLQRKNDKQAPSGNINPQATLAHLKELMQGGAARKIYLLLGDSGKYEKYRQVFCLPENPFEQEITDAGAGENPNICSLRGIQMRLFNYHEEE